MRYGLIEENMLERALLASQLVPTAMTESYGPAYARPIIVATERGIFEALAAGPLTPRDVARACNTIL